MEENTEGTTRFAVAYSFIANSSRRAKRAVLNSPARTVELGKAAWSKIPKPNISLDRLGYYIIVAFAYAACGMFVVSLIVLMTFFALILYYIWAPLGVTFAFFASAGGAAWLVALYQSIQFHRAFSETADFESVVRNGTVFSDSAIDILDKLQERPTGAVG
jgi:hypothetical protein